MQELVLRLVTHVGYTGRVELRTPSGRSVDVAAIDRRRQRLVLVECWNTIDDLGAALRATDRKREEIERLAVALETTGPLASAACWVVMRSRRNRALLDRYPQLIASRFRGASRVWVRALTTGSHPPTDPGIVWCDLRARRLLEVRA